MKTFASISLLLLLSAWLLQGCADPRKNCNHPKHSEWVKEQRMKKTGF